MRAARGGPRTLVDARRRGADRGPSRPRRACYRVDVGVTMRAIDVSLGTGGMSLGTGGADTCDPEGDIIAFSNECCDWGI